MQIDPYYLAPELLQDTNTETPLDRLFRELSVGHLNSSATKLHLAFAPQRLIQRAVGADTTVKFSPASAAVGALIMSDGELTAGEAAGWAAATAATSVLEIPNTPKQALDQAISLNSVADVLKRRSVANAAAAESIQEAAAATVKASPPLSRAIKSLRMDLRSVLKLASRRGR